MRILRAIFGQMNIREFYNLHAIFGQINIGKAISCSYLIRIGTSGNLPEYLGLNENTD